MDMPSSAPSFPASALTGYDNLIRPARERFAAARGVQEMTSPHADACTMAAFLLHFSGLSVPITEPVEGWIRRAGERCDDGGLHELGRALQRHAEAEAGHHLYHRHDFEALVGLWNQRWRPTIRAADITGREVTRGGKSYCDLHEANIRGSEPFCQFAIGYEIELLPVELGPLFVHNCVRLLGPDILNYMTFVTSHIELDVAHTRFNAHFLGRLIDDDPQRLPPLVAAGAAALGAFADHLTECWDLGLSLAQRSQDTNA